MTEHHGGEMEKKNATPSVRQLLCASAEKYGEEIFIKFVRNGAVEERSYVRVKTDSEAVCPLDQKHIERGHACRRCQQDELRVHNLYHRNTHEWQRRCTVCARYIR